MIQLNEKYKSFTSTELHLWNCFDLFSIAWKTNQNKSTSVDKRVIDNLNFKISTDLKKCLNNEAAIF